MGDNPNKVEAELRPVDALIPSKDAPASQLTVSTTPATKRAGPVPERLEEASQPAASDLQRIPPADHGSFQDFKAGDTDPLIGVKIREVLIGTENFFVYIDEDFSLHWRWSTAVESNCAAPIFTRAGELQAKSEFLRQTFGKRNLISARRLIGEGLVVMFCTQNLAYANATLDTAEKFVTQRGRETSRGWYFGPFFVFFAVSALVALIIYNRGQAQITTLPLVCCLAGGIGAFISTAIGNERIPCAPSAGRILHFLEALLRYTIGFSAGLLVWLATAGNIAVGFLNFANSASQSPLPGDHLPASIYALIAVALLAGTSERLLPSLITRFDDSTKGTPGAQSADSQTPKPNSTGKPS
jgi:hypothetical protein